MNNTEAATATQKKKGLDALRGLGITGIVLYHLFPRFFPGGFLGVPLFFVLSGYLMFVTSQRAWRKGQFHAGSYYRKRVKKILPPLFAMVMAVCCYLTLTHSDYLAGIRQEICSIFLGYDNWWQIHQNASYFSKLSGASPFTHLWFLAVEIQFYILWPLLFLLYRKGCAALGEKKMCFLFLLLAVLSAVRMLLLYTPGGDPSRVYYGTDTMAFPLLLGIFLGAARQAYPRLCAPISGNRAFTMSAALLLSLCALFVTVNGEMPLLYQGGMFFISLYFAGIIHFIENLSPRSSQRIRTPLLFLLGKKSYNIYLWHYPIIILTLI